MNDSELRKLSIRYPFSYSDIKEFQRAFKLNIKDLESIIEVSMKCHVSLDSVYQVLKGFKQCEEPRLIHDYVFYDKDLSDAIRDIVIKSPCNYSDALKFMEISKNYDRDIVIIKELLCVGVSIEIVLRVITILNTKYK